MFTFVVRRLAPGLVFVDLRFLRAEFTSSAVSELKILVNHGFFVHGFGLYGSHSLATTPANGGYQNKKWIASVMAAFGRPARSALPVFSST